MTFLHRGEGIQQRNEVVKNTETALKAGQWSLHDLAHFLLFLLLLAQTVLLGRYELRAASRPALLLLYDQRSFPENPLEPC